MYPSWFKYNDARWVRAAADSLITRIGRQDADSVEPSRQSVSALDVNMQSRAPCMEYRTAVEWARLVRSPTAHAACTPPASCKRPHQQPTLRMSMPSVRCLHVQLWQFTCKASSSCQRLHNPMMPSVRTQPASSWSCVLALPALATWHTTHERSRTLTSARRQQQTVACLFEARYLSTLEQ